MNGDYLVTVKIINKIGSLNSDPFKEDIYAFLINKLSNVSVAFSSDFFRL